MQRSGWHVEQKSVKPTAENGVELWSRLSICYSGNQPTKGDAAMLQAFADANLKPSRRDLSAADFVESGSMAHLFIGNLGAQ